MDHATTVENAVKRFYTSGDNDAHSWLVQAQASPEAWTFVWQLLDPSKPGEVQFFAATTLHAKITKHWNEVPKSEYLALQAQIVQVIKSPGTSKVALSRLCQALAAFMTNYNMSQTKVKEKCMVEELIEILPYNSPTTVDLLMRVIEEIPREYNRHQNVQLVVRDGLLENWRKTALLLQEVFSMCNQINDITSDILHLSCIECTLSWLKLGLLPLETMGPIYNHLLIAAGRYLPREEMEGGDSRDWGLPKRWEVTQECLTMLVTHRELYRQPQLFWEWAKRLICVVQEHGAKYYYEILTALGEAHSRNLLLALAGHESMPDQSMNEQVKWTAQKVTEYLLECSEQEGRYPVDERRSCIPFGFWYALQDDRGSLDEPLDKQATVALKPIYARLAQALLKKATLPSSPSEAGTPEERELLRCYRQDAADTLNYCYNVLKEDLFVLLGQRLSQSHNDVSRWTEVESTIHAFKAICDNLNGETDNQYVGAILDLIMSHIPYEIYPREVLASACSAVGNCASWIGEHPDPWLEQSLKLVALGLGGGPITASAASMALKDITRDCDQHLAPLAPSLLDTIGRMLPNVTPGAGEGLRLMYAAGKLLNTLGSREQQLSHLEATLGLFVMRLRELLQLPVNEAQIAVVNQLKMITVFFTTLAGDIGCAVLEALLPIFQAIVNHPEWSRNDAVLEAMHNCAQKSLPSLYNSDTDKTNLLLLVSASYKIRPHPAALEFLKDLVRHYGRRLKSQIEPVFSDMSELTLRGIATCQQVGGDLSELSELLEAYFIMLAHVCKRVAQLLLQVPDQVPEMLRCGIACLLLPETCKAAGNFLTQAITQSPHLQTFIQPIGQELVCAIIQCIGGSVPLNSLEPHAEVMLTLNKTCPCWTAEWLRMAVADENAPAGLRDKKDAFVHAIVRERAQKRRLHEKFRNFYMQCR